jgi:chaperonin GroEL
MATKTLKGNKIRNEILAGIKEVADIVGSTLGPEGKLVIIGSQYGDPKVTKDGVSVAKSIDLPQKYKALGAKLVKQAAILANDKAGDGTTSVTVLTAAMSKYANQCIVSGISPQKIKKGIEKAIKVVVEELGKKSKKVESREQVAQVATLSANGCTLIGKTLADAFEKVGKDGVVTVEEAKTNSEIELEFVEGMNFDRGYLSPYFITNPEKMIVEFENAYVLIVEKKISSIQQILPILEAIAKSGNPLFIIAEDVESEALATLVVNKIRVGLRVAAVKAPGFGDRRKAMLEDIAILTGATVISDDLGHKLENTTIEHLGKAQKVIATKDDTTIIGGSGKKDDVQHRCNMIKNQIQDTTSDYDREKLQERLAKLSGGVAIVRVGGVTEVAVKEAKDRVEDAYHATKAAIEEGIVVGGGCALLYASKELEALKQSETDQEVAAGINAVMIALSEPFKKILENAGYSGDVFIEKLLHVKERTPIVNAATGQIEDASVNGIFDPTKVVRVAVEAAASIAAIVINVEGGVVENSDTKKSARPGMDDDMGGMY